MSFFMVSLLSFHLGRGLRFHRSSVRSDLDDGKVGSRRRARGAKTHSARRGASEPLSECENGRPLGPAISWSLPDPARAQRPCSWKSPLWTAPRERVEA